MIFDANTSTFEGADIGLSVAGFHEVFVLDIELKPKLQNKWYTPLHSQGLAPRVAVLCLAATRRVLEALERLARWHRYRCDWGY